MLLAVFVCEVVSDAVTETDGLDELDAEILCVTDPDEVCETEVVGECVLELDTVLDPDDEIVGDPDAETDVLPDIV